MIKNIQISKLDAAKRQLETVIRLYFSHSDPVSIHTLTAAAYNIIRDINKKRSGPPMLVKDQFFDLVKPEFEKELRNTLNEAENFFKHANRDHESMIDFNPDQSEYMIIDACSQYYKLTGEFPPLFRVYQSWFVSNHRKLFNFSEDKLISINKGAAEIISMGRQDFFNTFLPLVMTMKI